MCTKLATKKGERNGQYRRGDRRAARHMRRALALGPAFGTVTLKDAADTALWSREIEPQAA
jgi:hypothetical protein